MVTFERLGNIDVVLFSTDTVNALNADEIRNSITQILSGGSVGMVINLAGVKYIDSSGFGLLLSLTRTARENYCKLRFCAVSAEVMKVLKMLHLHTVFAIDETLEESLASL